MKIFAFNEHTRGDEPTGRRLFFPGRDSGDATQAALSYMHITDSTASVKDDQIHSRGHVWKLAGETRAATGTIDNIIETMTDASIRNFRRYQALQMAKDAEEWICQACNLAMPYKELEKDHTSVLAPNRCPRCQGLVWLATTLEIAALRNKCVTARGEVDKVDKQLRDVKVELVLLRGVAQAAAARESAPVKFDNIPDGHPFKDELAASINARISLRDSVLALKEFYKEHKVEGAPLL